MMVEIVAEKERKGKSKEGGVKEVGEERLEEVWGRVKEDFWGDLKIEVVRGIKRLLETTMEVEVQDIIGSRRWEHKLDRGGYRNGHYRRGLLSSYGYIANIKIPRIREGRTEFKFFNKYQQRTKDVDELVLEMFLGGVSTRRIEEVLRPILGYGSISAGLVSKITKVLDKEVKRFHIRKIKDKYEYLILDGIYLNTKSPIYKKRRCILVAYGIWKEGKKVRRELIDYQMARKGESGNAWIRFLNGLYYRGLEGKRLDLITIDGNKGLRNALDEIYPNAKVQRCWAHKLRNVANKLHRKEKDRCIAGARKIYKAKNRKEAIQEYKKWSKEWRDKELKAVECLEEDLEELLSFYECEEGLRKKLRTTNIIERTFREVRRRTRPMSCFQNIESVERIIFAIFHRLNKKWGNEIYLEENALFNEITQKY